EEPEFVAGAKPGIGGESVVHLRPPPEGRGGAVHEDDGNAAAAMGHHGEQLGLLTLRETEPLEEKGVLLAPDWGIVERGREACGGLDLERDALPGDLDRLRSVRYMKLESAFERRPGESDA